MNGASEGGSAKAPPTTSAASAMLGTETLSPLLRTQRNLQRAFGANKAGRAAATALCSGAPLSRHQKQAFFRMAQNAGVSDEDAVLMMSLTEGQGITPNELDKVEGAGHAAWLSHKLNNGFENYAAEKAGPGSMSVILEAHSIMGGEESAVDMHNDDIRSVRTLRDMVAGRIPRPVDLAHYLSVISGGSKDDSGFWKRFARDALAIPGSEIGKVLTEELLLGRGLQKSQSWAAVEELMDAIEQGRKAISVPAPSADELKLSAALLLQQFKQGRIDKVEPMQVFLSFASTKSKTSKVDQDDDDKGGDMFELTLANRTRGGGGGKSSKKGEKGKKDQAEQQPTAEAPQQEEVPDEESPASASPKRTGKSVPIAEVYKVIVVIVRCAREIALHQAEDANAENAMKTKFKNLLLYVQGDEGKQQLDDAMGTYSPVDEETFESGWWKFVSMLSGEDPWDGNLAGKSSDTKKNKKKAKEATKRRNKIVGMDHDADSEAEDDDNGDGIKIPHGGKELLKYLARGKASARTKRDGPVGLAAVLYIAVNKALPHAAGITLQNLLIGSPLTKGDVANLLAILSDTRGSQKNQGIATALIEFRALTDEVWKEHDDTGGGGDEDALVASPRGANMTEPGVGLLLRKLACGENHLEQEEIEELYAVAKQCLSPYWLGKAGLEGLFNGNFPTDPDPKAPASLSAEAPESSQTSKKGVRMVNPLDLELDDEMTWENPMELTKRVQGGKNKKSKKETNATSDSEDGADEDMTWGNPLRDDDNGDDNDDDEAIPVKLSKKEAKKRAKEESKQKKIVGAAVIGGTTAAAVSLGDSDATTAENPILEGEQTDASNPTTGYFGRVVEYLEKEAAAAFAKAAEEFKPVWTESSDQSLIRLIVAQSKNECVMAAFMQLVEPSAAPSDQQMAALHELAAKEGVAADVINVLVWLWTGGTGMSKPMLERMVVPPRSGAIVRAGDYGDGFIGAQVDISIIRASNILKKCSVFASVRVEGHQRNTQIVGSSTSPEWFADDADSASFSYRVVDYTSANVEIALYARNKKQSDDELGCVTFPLGLLDEQKNYEHTLNIEPSNMIPNSLKGTLGTLTIRLCYVAETPGGKSAPMADPGSEPDEEAPNPDPDAKLSKQESKKLAKQKKSKKKKKRNDQAIEKTDFELLAETGGILTSEPVEKLVEACKNPSTGGVMNAEVINLLREAASLILARPRDLPQRPTLQELQSDALDDIEATGVEVISDENQADKDGEILNARFNKYIIAIDKDYDEGNDQETEASYTVPPLRAKYLAAISFCLSKFLGINPAALDQIGDTINKFDPAPEVTGGYAAAVLGTIGLDHKMLSGVKSYLNDRLQEEMQKLLLISKLDSDWNNQLKMICRGEGCTAKNVDLAKERIGQADSFAAAAALMRLKNGQRAAEQDEMNQLDALVATCGDNFIIAGVQNLQLMIWPAREVTFDLVKELVQGNSLAEAAVGGWERRAELALILLADETATQALHGLVHIESFEKKLEDSQRTMERQALKKLLRGDKNATAMMRKLTPSLRTKLREMWAETGKLAKFQAMFIGAAVLGMIVLKIVMAILTAVSLHDTIIGEIVNFVVNLVIFVASCIIGVFVALYYVMKGKPYRDNVVGPHPSGVQLLRNLAEASEEKEDEEKRIKCLDDMLMGVEADEDAKGFFRSRALKFAERVPEGIEAFECMEIIRILQQAGKSTAKIKEHEVQVLMPALSDLCPPSRDGIQDGLSRAKTKLTSLAFSAKVHPWMKKYAMHAGNLHELFHTVEIPLTMMKDNATKFDALDKLHKGYRPDGNKLRVLLDIVSGLNSLSKSGRYGEAATSLRDGMEQANKQKPVQQIFDEIDADGSGTLTNAEFDVAAKKLSTVLGFELDDALLAQAFAELDTDESGGIEINEFETWWNDFAVSQTERKQSQLAKAEAAGLTDESPPPSELRAVLKLLMNGMPTTMTRIQTIECLEDLCPDDETFDLMQECWNLCELKRCMINDEPAFNAIIGLEAMCVVPKLLEGDENLDIAPNIPAQQAIEKVQRGDPASLAALANLRQREHRRIWGMLTQRQRRMVITLGCFVALPVLFFSMGGTDSMLNMASSLASGFSIEAVGCNSTNGTVDVNGSIFTACNETLSDETGPATTVVVADTNATSSDSTVESASNPSFYILGAVPMALSLFVGFFGGRIASMVTMISVFASSAAVGIAAAFGDGTSEFTPAKLMGVAGGVYAGGVATKVASGNIKFAYGVQGAAIGAILCRSTTTIWQPKVLWLLPEVAPYVEWVNLTMAGIFAAGAAKISNQYRGLISVFSTAALGTLGSVQMLTAYGVPNMDRFTLSSLMSGQAYCGTDEDGCWASLAVAVGMLYGGTMNQFKMLSMDFSLPAVTLYDKALAKVDSVMSLLFKVNEFLTASADFDTADLMEHAMQARGKMAKYANFMTNFMHFSLCFGFAADFALNVSLGLYSAAPHVGMLSLLLAIVTPIQGTIGILSDILTSRKFATRLKEVKVPPILRKLCAKRFIKESIVIEFGPIGKYLQRLSFFSGMVNIFVSVSIVGMAYLTADMYKYAVKANWDELSVDMPDLTMEQAMQRTSDVVSGLGDSAMGLVAILTSGISTAAFTLGGLPWLLTNVVAMEKYFILGAGAIIGGVSFKLGSDYPAGNYMFLPLGITGVVTLFLGSLKAIPWFEKTFPDLMFLLHKAQILVCMALGLMTCVIITVARNSADFINSSWDGCQYQVVCEFTGAGNFSFAQYSSEQNMSKEDLAAYIAPMLYAGSMSCLATVLMIVGGSNMSKRLYYQNVMTRKEELSARQAGDNPAEAREQALEKKVRRVRNAEIQGTAASVQAAALAQLEERALAMELATGTPMELHYDLAQHDIIVEEIQKSAEVQQLPEGDEDDDRADSDRTRERPGLAGAMDTGSTLASLARKLDEEHQSEEVTTSQNVSDSRAHESQTLESRVEGAQVLLEKTKHVYLATWGNMPVFSKREAVYAMMASENGADEQAGGIPGTKDLVPQW